MLINIYINNINSINLNTGVLKLRILLCKGIKPCNFTFL